MYESDKLELNQYKIKKDKLFNIMKVINKTIHYVSGGRYYVNSVLKPYITKWMTYRDFSIKIFDMDACLPEAYLEVKGKSQLNKKHHCLNIYFSIRDVIISFNVITLCSETYYLRVRYTANKDITTPEAIGNIIHLYL